MDKIAELEAMVVTLRAEGDKFYNKGNNAAGTRVRKAAMEIKTLAQDIRVDVQELKNNK